MMDFIGAYRVVRELGHGGMGTVYEVEHAERGERLALKRFTLDHGNHDFLRKRFLAEAKLLSRLDHPRLVKVRELAIDADGETPYFVMDLVLNAEGKPETLADVRRRGGVTEQLAMAWFEDLRAGLSYTHSQGVVHRDVKLENVLVDVEGHAVLSDFGVSRIFDERMRSELMVTTTFIAGVTTGTQPVMGTYWYLAPEIRKGGEATPASDWYALGVLMYRLLTGMWYEPNTKAFDLLAPFSRECRALVRRLVSDDPEERQREVPRKRGTRRLFASLVSVAVVVASVSLALLFRGGGENVAASPAPIELEFARDVGFRFMPCPAGTNSFGRLSPVVTSPYHLAEAPVTWRQWNAVMGRSDGGVPAERLDSPVTYLTREEALGFCSRLTRRFARELPPGCEVRLPTVAEWRLAYQVGNTDTNRVDGDSFDVRRARCEIGWFGQGPNGMPETSNMKRYFEERNLKAPLVSETWPEFPPRQMHLKGSSWIGNSSRFVPVPVKLKSANGLGLYDMFGNCFEMCADCVATNNFNVFVSEFGFLVKRLYADRGSSPVDPVEMSGPSPAMLGSYLSPGVLGDEVWASPFDRLPHLGFRPCIGPKLPRP